MMRFDLKISRKIQVYKKTIGDFSSSRKGLPKWYYERQQKEKKELEPLVDDLKVLGELREDGNSEDYQELKNEVIKRHLQKLDIREKTLDKVKKLIQFNEIQKVI